MVKAHESVEWRLGLDYLDQSIASFRQAVAAARFSKHLDQLIEAGYIGDESPSGGGRWVGPAIESNYQPYTRRDRINMRLNALQNPVTGPAIGMAKALIATSFELATIESEEYKVSA